MKWHPTLIAAPLHLVNPMINEVRNDVVSLQMKMVGQVTAQLSLIAKTMIKM
jgi:hypothetical protein